MAGKKLSELKARLAKLSQSTVEGFGHRAEELREAATALGRGEEAARETIQRLAHKFRGIAGSAGHENLGVRAGRLEDAARRGAADIALIEGAKRLAAAAEKAARDSVRPAPRQRAATPAAAPLNLGWRVVALDDEPSTRRLLEITLAIGKCEAKVLEDPDEAVAALDERADLLIVDAMMPTTNGFEIYQRVRPRLPSLPIVILSAATSEELGWQLPDDPKLSWMRKPFRPAVLLGQLRAFVVPE